MTTTVYPGAIDTLAYLEVIDGVTSLDSAYFLRINDAIRSVETTCGIFPQGVYSTIRERLDSMEIAIGGNAIGGSAHSLTLATKFRLDIVSPIIPIPGPGTATLSSVVGKCEFVSAQEASFDVDAYGSIYWCNRVYVDQDISSLRLSLYDVTAAPVQIATTTLTSGEHTYKVLIAGILDNTSKIYEVRASQASSGGERVNSLIWNSRLLFLPTYPSQAGPSGAGTTYIFKDFNEGDVIAGSLSIGNIPINSMVQNIAIVIETAFDGGTTINVGETNDELMSASENMPSIVGTYYKSNDLLYENETEILATFGGSPTDGSGMIVIYFGTSS